jgi:Bacterial regulatory protein, Fis family
VSIGMSGIRELAAHQWSGNVRQLRSVVERAVFGADRPVLEAADFGVVIERLARRLTPAVPLSAEGMELLARLEASRWDTVLVAQQLGVTRKTVYSRIAKFGLKLPTQFERAVGALSAATSLDGQHARHVRPYGVIDASRHTSAMELHDGTQVRAADVASSAQSSNLQQAS